jgi:hypothetical protein
LPVRPVPVCEKEPASQDVVEPCATSLVRADVLRVEDTCLLEKIGATAVATRAQGKIDFLEVDEVPLVESTEGGE